jgi:hypothetical protein
MSQKKRALSPSGMDKLMKRLGELAQEDLEKPEDENTTGLQESEITTSFLKYVTKIRDLEDVEKRNHRLTNHFRGLVDMYGFDTMLDMYIYAQSCDLVPETVFKAKDYSKLVPVKRKVVRNGKEHEVTIWTKPDGGAAEEEEGDGSASGGKVKGGGKPGSKHAKDLISDLVGKLDDKPKDIEEIKAAAKDMPKGNKSFQNDSQFYLVIRDEEEGIAGVIGYSKEGKYLKMDFYRSNGEVSGVAAKGFFELIKLAAEEKQGVKMEDQPEARHIFMQSGLEQQSNGDWTIEPKTLQKLLGKESGTESE